MVSAYIAYIQKNKSIKCVSVDSSGELDELGTQLIEYFNDFYYVKSLVKTSIDYICDGEPEYIIDPDENDEDELEFEEYCDKEDLINSMSYAYYYLFENDKWYVCKPNCEDFKELEMVLEEEF